MRSKLGWTAAALALALGFAWWWMASSPTTRLASREGAPVAGESTASGPAAPIASELVEFADGSNRAERQPTMTTEPQSPPVASLRVQVVGAETGAPLSGIRVQLEPTDPAARERWMHTNAGESVGGPYRILTSDQNGQVEFAIRSPIAFELTATGQTWNPDDLNDVAGTSTLAIAALAPGEVRSVRVEVPVGSDLRFVGRLLASEDDTPIAGARVRLLSPMRGEPPVQVSDQAGLFELRSASWKRSGRFTVKVAGRTERKARLEPGHESPETAFTIRLPKSATLRVLARDPSGQPAAGIELLATTYGADVWEEQDMDLSGEDRVDPSCSATTDADGRAELDGLASYARIQLSALRDQNVVLRVPGQFVLKPGETRDLELVVGSGATLRGTVTDHTGRVAPGVTVWLVHAPDGAPRYFQRSDEPEAIATSDADGRFELMGVAAGTWRLGPAFVEVDRSKPATGLLAPAPQRVDVLPEASVVDVALTVHRDRYISGQVVDLDGNGVPGANLEALCDDLAWLWATADDTGNFRCGLVGGGTFELAVNAGFNLDYAPGDPVRATPDSSGVVLYALPAAQASGKVIDRETGEPASAEMLCSRIDVRDFASGVPVGPLGNFRIGGMNAGRYAIIATLQGKIAAVDFEVAQGGRAGPFTLELEPQAKLELACEESLVGADYLIRCNGIEVDRGEFVSDRPRSIALLPGNVVIEFTPKEESIQRSVALQLAPHESRRFVLPKRP